MEPPFHITPRYAEPKISPFADFGESRSNHPRSIKEYPIMSSWILRVYGELTGFLTLRPAAHEKLPAEI
jgi:hypothetical protein